MPARIAWLAAAGLMAAFLLFIFWPGGGKQATETPRVDVAIDDREADDPAPIPGEPSEVLDDSIASLPVGHRDRQAADQNDRPARDGGEKPRAASPQRTGSAADERARSDDAAKIAAVRFSQQPVDAPGPPTSEIRERDVAAALELPIVRFEQARAVPAISLLWLLEDMAGVPIRLDPEADADTQQKLEQPISLTLERTTLREVLAALTERVGLTYDIEPGGIRLRNAK